MRQLIGFTAQTFVPVAGLVLRRHLDNLAALDTQLPPFPALPSNARLFVLAPHPDDETLGAGGLILRARAAGIPVQIGFLSNGDGSRTTQISQILRGKSEKTLPEIARFRQLEALEAAQNLGVAEENVLFFGFPDGGARALWNEHWGVNEPFTSRFTGYSRVEYERAFAPGTPYCRTALIENLTQAFEAFAPTLVLTTHPRDTHPDHAVAYLACQAAISRLSSPKRPDLRAFLIHYRIWPVPNGFHPDLPLMPPRELLRGGTGWSSLTLSPDEMARKKAALECHRTQLGSTPRYLRAFVRRNEIFGAVE